MEELVLGTYGLLTNFVLESKSGARFGVVAIENGRALLYERLGDAQGSKPVQCIFSELGIFQFDRLIKKSVNIEVNYLQVNEIRVVLRDIPSAYTVIHDVKPRFRGEIDGASVTLVDKVDNLEDHSFHINWAKDFDVDVDDFPKILDIEKNYYFDYYDGPIHGVLILKSGACLVYDRYIDITGFHSSGFYIFGETTLESVEAVRKLDWDIVGKGLPSISKKELRTLFDSSRAEYCGVMDSFAAPALFERVCNVPRILLEAGWGGTFQHPRKRGYV